MEQRIGPQCGLECVVFAQHSQDRFEEVPIFHAECDLLQVESVDVFTIEKGQNFLGGAVLGNKLPTGCVRLARLLDHVKSNRRHGANELLVLRHMDWELDELARQREIEEVID